MYHSVKEPLIKCSSTKSIRYQWLEATLPVPSFNQRFLVPIRHHLSFFYALYFVYFFVRYGAIKSGSYGYHSFNLLTLASSSSKK